MRTEQLRLRRHAEPWLVCVRTRAPCSLQNASPSSIKTRSNINHWLGASGMRIFAPLYSAVVHKRHGCRTDDCWCCPLCRLQVGLFSALKLGTTPASFLESPRAGSLNASRTSVPDAALPSELQRCRSLSSSRTPTAAAALRNPRCSAFFTLFPLWRVCSSFQELPSSPCRKQLRFPHGVTAAVPVVAPRPEPSGCDRTFGRNRQNGNECSSALNTAAFLARWG